MIAENTRTVKNYEKERSIMSTLLALIFERLVSYIGFQPPIATYHFILERHLRPDGTISTEWRMELNDIALNLIHKRKFEQYSNYLKNKSNASVKPFFVKTSRGNHLVCLSLIPPEIEHNHSNATDMGILIGSIYRVARRTKCAVIMYDYSGYGLSSGKPSERNIYADIETIIQYLVRQKQIDSKSIILYGESIGSVPSIYMASQMSVGGVILQAPLTSGLTTLAASCLRTVVNLNIAWSFDPFPNINRIDKLDCPVLVIHGLRDSHIHFSHGLALYQKCRHKVSPLFFKDGDHNNLRSFGKFFERTKSFVSYVECFHNKARTV